SRATELPASSRRRVLTCLPPPHDNGSHDSRNAEEGEIRLREICRCPTIGCSKLSTGGIGMDDLYLRSGIFLAPFHNHDENPTLSIERDLELLEHLDRLNYHEAWIGEHHSGGVELIACPEMFIAAAQRTRHIRLGTGVVSLPYHNPFMLADRMVQLDHMTRGRAMFGVGPGAL